MLAFISVLIWMLRKSSSPKLRLLAMMALAGMLIGIIMDWQQPPYVDLNFKEHAHRFEGSPIGTEIVIPINPPGWYMSLTKH
jgi:hypothetical protein